MLETNVYDELFLLINPDVVNLISHREGVVLDVATVLSAEGEV